jgi:hypothetical protein
MARETGLEPATSGVTGRRSNQLSYSRSACELSFGATWALYRGAIWCCKAGTNNFPRLFNICGAHGHIMGVRLALLGSTRGTAVAFDAPKAQQHACYILAIAYIRMKLSLARAAKPGKMGNHRTPVVILTRHNAILFAGLWATLNRQEPERAPPIILPHS